MQQMISHQTPLPACRNGHVPRHIHDYRRASAGGGHSLECRCTHTNRHAEYDEAMHEWCVINGHPVPVLEAQRPLPLKLVSLRASA